MDNSGSTCGAVASGFGWWSGWKLDSRALSNCGSCAAHSVVFWEKDGSLAGQKL